MLKYTSVETYSVLQASCLQHWFKNWQALRRNKLTASTFAAAIGFWRRQRVQLWLEKIGAIEPFSGNLATCWSNIKEEEALERYKLITGNTVLFPEFQVYDSHPEDSWLAASPDGVIDSLVHELPSRGVLEIKCPYFDGDRSYMEDSEQRKKRLKEMRMQAEHAAVSGAVEGFATPGSLSNPLIEAPLTMQSRDKSYAAPRFDFYTDPMSAFSSNKRNNTIIQAAPDSFPPNVGASPMAQYSSPHPESTNPQMTLPPFQVSAAAYRNPDLSGPRGPALDNFPFHPSTGGRYPNPRFEPSGGPLYNSPQGIAHRPSYSPNPSPGYWNSPRPNYTPNPSPGYRNSPRPSYSSNPSPGYSSSPRPCYSPSPGQGRGRGLWHNPGSSVSGRGSGRGPNFHGRLSNDDAARGPNRFYKSSMVEDPWNHLEPKIWEAIEGSLHTSRISEKVKPWISKSKSTTGVGSSAASVKSSSEPSLAEYLAAAVNEAANNAENV